jgi:hypothetical protein
VRKTKSIILKILLILSKKPKIKDIKLDRINRMNRMFFAFPEERQKSITYLRGRQQEPQGLSSPKMLLRS